MAEIRRPHGRPPDANPYPFGLSRFCIGMPLAVYLRLLARNGLRITTHRLALALAIVWTGAFNSVAAAGQRVAFGRRLAATPVAGEPIFVLGHWRSGTTLLHELLALDERFATPGNLECFAPSHFLLTHPLVARLGFLLPRLRPMDNMTVTMDSPQEDEFAYLGLGLRTPYTRIVFPNEPERDRAYLTLEGVTGADRDRWKAGVDGFLRALTVRFGRRLVLKSPAHTGRVAVLRELYPDARFVHIVREPRRMFASTLRLWEVLWSVEALQEPTFAGLEDHVLGTFEEMYDAFERARPFVPPERLAELRYEDLVADPVSAVREVYATLGMDGFDAVAPRIVAYFARRADYRTNRFTLDSALAGEVDRRWGPYLRRFGYAVQAPEDTGPPHA